MQRAKKRRRKEERAKMNRALTHWREAVETVLRCDLAEAIGIEDSAEAENLIEEFLHAISNQAAENRLEREIDPQWVILAAGKGTRIDPSGRLNKLLDIWFGEQNALQLARSYLPGTRPHIIVINHQTAAHVVRGDIPTEGMIPDSALDRVATDALFGPNAILCLQPEQSAGTGAALQAALPAVAESDAEFIGVAFGDEPFLNQAIFLQTVMAHFIAGADVTLCGKRPETVVDKGGLFFDDDGKLIGTKEWYDMTAAEKEEMWRRFERGEAYTNTGITLILRDAAIKRMGRLQPHGSKSELHHVDLIRYCYEDGLKTHAYIHQGEIVSGINRWSNVLVGEASLFEKTRLQLAQKGVRVDPTAQVTLENPDIEFGYGCYLLGRIHLGKAVRIGSYCRLENAVLLGNTVVGDHVGLKDVRATDTAFESNPLLTELTSVATPITGLAVQSQIENCRLDCVKVGQAVYLSRVNGHTTIIPSGVSVSDVRLGVPNHPRSAQERDYRLLIQLMLPGYKPGVFTFGDKRGLPDWENLRTHVKTHSERELISRATRQPMLRQVAVDAVNDLLDMKKADGTYATDALTAEELWGSIFELVALCTGNPDAYRNDKRRARHTAMNLLREFSDCNWIQRIKLVVAANIIDYSSARVVKALEANPFHFVHALLAAIHAPFAIDCFEAFRSMVIEGEPKRLVWLADNDGETVFDLWCIEMLAELGHQITIVGKESPASNDATLTDLLETAAHARFHKLQEQIAFGAVSLISSGSKTAGTNLHQATGEFANVLLDADLVISKGQGNFYTTQGLIRDTFYLLLSKGVTAERTTGVAPDPDKAIDGLILAYVPGSTRLDQTLKKFCC
jgi:uncharacterized protein with ATP-grasp and redox domains/bifunctional N-acetylglucosamine-1-phosphate-uridyltransferase/glucosamine-1-phosphate-acetyltransferase GlmU-like protein